MVSSVNPANVGQAITFTATVVGTYPGSNAPTGSVTFVIDGVAAGTAALVNGVATFATSSLARGTHTVTAVYAGGTKGDITFSGSTSAPLQQVVGGAVAAPIYAVASDAGSLPIVSVFDSQTGALKFSLLAFPGTFRGGVRVAIGDVLGNGVNDIICAAGPGALPLVSVFDGNTGQLIYSFLAPFAIVGTVPLTNPLNTPPGSFTGGIFVAAGDVTGAGHADIIIGADRGGGPEVAIFDGKTAALISVFFAFPFGFTGGVRVAAADVNGSGRDHVICAAGPGAGPQVSIFDGVSTALVETFYAFAPFFHGGVYVAAGDVAGTGRTQIIVGAGAGGGPQVTVFDSSTLAVLDNFFVYPVAFTGGVRVGAGPVNSSGRAALLVGPGLGGLPQLEAFDGRTLALVLSLLVTTGPTSGLFVAGH